MAATPLCQFRRIVSFLLLCGAQPGVQFQQIRPGFAFGGRVAQQVGGVEHRQAGPAQDLYPIATHSGNAGAAQKRLTGRIAHQYDDLWLSQGDMAFQKWQHHCNFGRIRRAVRGRAPGQDIGDIDAACGIVRSTAHPDCLKHPVQQLTGPPHKGPPGAILFAPRCFANNHDTRRRLAITEHKIARAAFQLAMLKALHRGRQRAKIARSLCRLARQPDRIELRVPGLIRHRPGGLLRCCRLRRWRHGLQRIAIHGRVQNSLGRPQFDLPFQKCAVGPICLMRIHRPQNRTDRRGCAVPCGIDANTMPPYKTPNG